MYTIYKLDENYYPVKMLGTTDDLPYAKGYRTRMSKKNINIGIHTN